MKKGWQTCRIDLADPISHAFQRFSIGYADPRLEEESPLQDLVDEIVELAVTHKVLLAIDAPICVPGGTNADPTTAAGFERPKMPASWPFNVNSFVQRPCEKALSSRPAGSIHGALAELADCISQHLLKGVDGSFVGLDRNNGVSVRTYDVAPHGPVVRTFIKLLIAAAGGMEISFDPQRAETSTNPGIHILESHPAVSLGFWSANRPDFGSISKYKRKPQTITRIAASLEACVVADTDLRSACNEVSGNDDKLDAFVAAINARQLAEGEGDWFGTVASGYFLAPRVLGSDRTFHKLWSDAERQSKEAHGRQKTR